MEEISRRNQKEWVHPERLHKGDTIGFVSPCYKLDKEYADKASRVLENLGFCVKYAEHLFSDAWGFSGTAQERAEDFHQMILDDEVKMLLFTGGEVSTHLLPLLDYELIRNHPKIISSYSDSTSLLNAISEKSRIVTFYGQSIRTFADCCAEPDKAAEETEDTEGYASETSSHQAQLYNLRVFRNRLVEGDCRYEAASPWKVLHGGKAKGRLTGGYLVNYTLIQNTPWFCCENWKETEKPILFLEDHEKFNESAAVSRYLSCLEQAGVFEKASGLIFGHYSENAVHFYEETNKNKDEIVDEILFRIGEKHRIPVVRTDDFGHGEYNQILPIGGRAALDADEGTFFLYESGVL